MKVPKIAKAMNDIDSGLVESAANVTAKKTGNVWIKWVAVAAAFVLIFSGVMAFMNSGSKPTAVIALDVNPSIEIEIDKDSEIVRVIPLNEDAKVVLGDMNFEDVNLDVGINAIIGSMLKNGYLTVDKNSILVSVSSKDGEKAEQLKSKISKEIEAMLAAGNIDASVITQSFETGDPEDGVSAAKKALIKKIINAGVRDSKGNIYTFEKLKSLNINELKLILESKLANVEGIVTEGSASEGQYIGRENALQTALTHANITKENSRCIEVEFDFENGKMIYDIEFKSGEYEYDYEIDAVSGEVLFTDKELDDHHGEQEADHDHIIPDGNYIGKEAALEKTLAHAGLTSQSVYALEIELDKERGMVVYEIDFKSGNYEYEYEVDATTGEVLKSEKEIDD